MNEKVRRFRDESQTALDTEDRRREPRFPASARVEIEIQKPAVGRVQGTVFEVSRSGLRLELPLAIEAGTFIKINLKNVVVSGEVRHCRPEKAGFSAGVFVKEVSVPEKFDQLDDRELDLYSILVQFGQMR